MTYYNQADGYNPAAAKIDPNMAHVVALRYAGKSLAIKRFTQTRAIADLREHFNLLIAIERLYSSVPRGRGYCLERAALANLRGYVLNYKMKGYAFVEVEHVVEYV